MRKAERTKQFILEKASVILNEKGIAGLTVDNVPKAASVARGCLYNHFKNVILFPMLLIVITSHRP